MGLRRLLLALAIALGSSSIAYAAPSPRDKADAAVLTGKARAAGKAKKYDEAVDLLRKAIDLEPTVQRKLDLAKLLVPQGKLVEASQLLNGIANDATLAPNEKWAKDSAKKQLATFESRIPWLTVHVAGASKARVEVDGREVEADSETPVDPGKHTIGVDADGFESADTTATLADSEHKQVTVTLTPGTPREAPKPKTTPGTKWPAIASFVVGAAGIGVGAAFGVLAFDETNKAKAYCNGNVCPNRPEVIDARDVAIANGNVSTVGFVIGGVGVAAGVILALTVGASHTEKEPEKKDAVVIRPYFGGTEIGLVGRF